jgi:hypothetical protein
LLGWLRGLSHGATSVQAHAFLQGRIRSAASCTAMRAGGLDLLAAISR